MIIKAMRRHYIVRYQLHMPAAAHATHGQSHRDDYKHISLESA